jgi:hypothetical protein
MDPNMEELKPVLRIHIRIILGLPHLPAPEPLVHTWYGSSKQK